MKKEDKLIPALPFEVLFGVFEEKLGEGREETGEERKRGRERRIETAIRINYNL